MTCAALCSCRAEAEAGDDNEEPDGHGTADPGPRSAKVTRGPSPIRASLHGEVGSIVFPLMQQQQLNVSQLQWCESR